jgi:hypothetical protein
MLSCSVSTVPFLSCSVDSCLSHRVSRVTFSSRISCGHRSVSRTIFPWTISWSTFGLRCTRSCYCCPHDSNSCHSHLIQCFHGISWRWFGCQYEGHVEVLNQVLSHICQSRSSSRTGVSVIVSRRVDSGQPCVHLTQKLQISFCRVPFFVSLTLVQHEQVYIDMLAAPPV